MQKIVISNIEIIYEDNKTEKVNYIKSVINNNIDFFKEIFNNNLKLSLVPIDLENVIYIEDFDDFFKQIVFNYINLEKIKKDFDDPDLLPNLYIEMLIRKYSINDKQSLLKPNPQISEETIEFLISYKYFSLNGTFDDFVNYLKTRRDTDKIRNWLFEECRFKIYNYILKTIVSYLRDRDFEFIENVSEISFEMLASSINLTSFKDYDKKNSATITKQELDNLIWNFFDFIKAPISWTESYKQLKKSKKIIFENSNDSYNFSQCYLDSDNQLKIKIKFDGTVNSFYSFIHEFTHYMSMKDFLQPSQISVSEIPSIFFERQAMIFLKNIGFNENDINTLIDRRKINNFQLYLNLLPLFLDLNKYIKDGELTKKDKVKLLERQIETIKEINKKFRENIEINSTFGLNKLIDMDIYQLVDNQCDSLINYFLKEGLFIINGYQYILATFITDELLKRYAFDLDVIFKMFDITSNLNIVELEDILIVFEIEDLFSQFKEEIRKVKIK